MTHGAFVRLIIDLKFINFYRESSCDIRIEFIIIIFRSCVCERGVCYYQILGDCGERTQWQPVDLWLSMEFYRFIGFHCFLCVSNGHSRQAPDWIAQSKDTDWGWGASENAYQRIVHFMKDHWMMMLPLHGEFNQALVTSRRTWRCYMLLIHY